VLGTSPGESEELTAGVVSSRPVVGQARGGPPQLHGEHDPGDWILDPARREDAFSDDARELWPEVLTRKGGSYALVARMPADPSTN
jgi:putative transcriptional regulator